MTDESKKISAIPFEQAATLPVHTAKNQNTQSVEVLPSDRQTLFYGAAYNLLYAFFKEQFAPNIEDSNFETLCDGDDHSFKFILAPNPKPDQKYKAADLYKCALSFRRYIDAIASDAELDSFISEESHNPKLPAFMFKFETQEDLMTLLEEIAKPYNITLGISFNAKAFLVADKDDVSFGLSPLYSIEHVRTLYRHTQGYSCEGLGLQLSH